MSRKRGNIHAARRIADRKRSAAVASQALEIGVQGAMPDAVLLQTFQKPSVGPNLSGNRKKREKEKREGQREILKEENRRCSPVLGLWKTFLLFYRWTVTIYTFVFMSVTMGPVIIIMALIAGGTLGLDLCKKFLVVIFTIFVNLLPEVLILGAIFSFSLLCLMFLGVILGAFGELSGSSCYTGPSSYEDSQYEAERQRAEERSRDERREHKRREEAQKEFIKRQDELDSYRYTGP